jgi:hypothetical protein
LAVLATAINWPASMVSASDFPFAWSGCKAQTQSTRRAPFEQYRFRIGHYGLTKYRALESIERKSVREDCSS